MAIQHRKATRTPSDKNYEENPTTMIDGKLEKSHARSTTARIGKLVVGLLVVIGVVFIVPGRGQFSLSTIESTPSTVLVVKVQISEIATLVGYFQRLDNDQANAEKIALGVHRIQVSFKQDKCPNPLYAIRLSGAALVHIPLEEDKETFTWTGQVSLPTPGMYRIEVAVSGCHGEPTGEISRAVHPVPLEAVGPSVIPIGHQSNDIFPLAHWLPDDTAASPVEYSWVDPSRQERTMLKAIDASVVRESVATNANGFFQFEKLSNYELLCFLGNKTMSQIRDQFLSLRSQISKGQRPFKFHMYELARDLQRPDQYWTVENKKRLRKCKHILVNLEEFERPPSQKAYEKDIITFVGHLLKLMNDTTFPIRLLTWTESPLSATACHDSFLKRTTDHPCNEVLKNLFNPKDPFFPSRVKLLDSSDITMPLLGEHRTKAIANIALRVFAIAGQQVTIWRNAGQIGKVDGLHRNNTVEPNFELLPYEGWG